MAWGSDTGGSIRIPAALNGIVGFKSTARAGANRWRVAELSTTLDTVCAMTRSVRDAILAHEVLAQRTVTRSQAPLAAYRLAVAQTTLLDDMDGAVARAFGRALGAPRVAGARIDEIPLTELRELGAIQSTGGFSAAESHAWHRPLLERCGDQYDPRVRVRIERGAAMKAHEYIELTGARADWIGARRGSVAGL